MVPVPPVPPVAARTYMAIRIGVVAVIVALLLAVGREIASEPDRCTQRSLSAYFHTPVMPVFVGALLIIGFAMVVMWGSTIIEDAALNLAGLLLMVVAIVPTLDANYCSVSPELRDAAVDPEAKSVADKALIHEHADTVQTTFWAFLVIVALVLAFTLVMGLRQQLVTALPSLSLAAVIGYAITWLLALAAWVTYVYLFQSAGDENSFFNHGVHSWSANIGVGFIIVAVLAAASEAALSNNPNAPWWLPWKPVAEWGRWVWLYGGLGILMVLVAVVIKVGDQLDWFDGWFDGWLDTHATFTLEVVLIVLLAVYWILQTIQRRKTGAPTF